MELKPIQARPDWQKRVEATGLAYHSAGGAYWDETRYFQFSQEEADELEDATEVVVQMLMDRAADLVVNQRDLLRKVFSDPMIDILQDSLNEGWPAEYGRFDFGMVDGVPKVFEYNADTPVCLIEGSITQWEWFYDKVRAGEFVHTSSETTSGQYQLNSIYERLLGVFKPYAGKDVLVVCCKGPWLEYEATSIYLREVAWDAGCKAVFRWVEDLEMDLDTYEITDGDKAPAAIVKLYPSEWFVKDLEEKGLPFPEKVLTANNFIERPFKLLLGGKFMLAELYKHHPDCPWLIPAWHTREECLDKKVVAKSWYGRIGTEVEILEPGQQTTLQGPVVYQLYTPTERYDGYLATLGSWHINGGFAGIGIRAQKEEITKDDCLFFPHVVNFVASTN